MAPKLIEKGVARIHITGEVNYDMLKAVDTALIDLGKEADPNTKKKVLVVISSNGGHCDVGEAIVERFGFASELFDLSVVGATFVGSMGSAIFLGFPKERRFLTPHCQLMIHQYSRGSEEIKQVPIRDLQRMLAERIELSGKNLAGEERTIKQLIKDTRGNLTPQQVRNWWREGHVFSASEAVRYGIAAGIVRQ